MEKLNVTTVDDNSLILNTLDKLISAEDGLSIIGKADNGVDAINMIVDTVPDTVLLDLVISKTDGISVVEKVENEHTFLKNPTFIILNTVGGEQMTEDVFKAGANYHLMKPFDKETLISKIRHIGKPSNKQPARKVMTTPFKLEEESYITREGCMREYLEMDITKMFHELDIPAHTRGYQYLWDAIAMSVEDWEMMSSVTKVLYPAIARCSQVTISRVERAIRHAIEVAWGRGKMEVIDKVFGHTVNTGESEPTNSKLIALIPDKILLGYKKIQDKSIRNNFLISEK